MDNFSRSRSMAPFQSAMGQDPAPAAPNALLGLAALAGIWYALRPATKVKKAKLAAEDSITGAYVDNVKSITERNKDFRKVLFTGDRSQLVAMNIPPKGEIGKETHKHVEQSLFFLSGNGQAIINGKAKPVGPGDVVVVSPGTTHNFKNTGRKPLKVYTIYAPPNHIDGTVHHTKADADADVADEAFGSKVR